MLSEEAIIKWYSTKLGVPNKAAIHRNCAATWP